MQSQIWNKLEIPIRRKQWAAVFQRLGGDPIVGVWQLYSTPCQLRTQMAINHSSDAAGLQNFKCFQKFTGLLKNGGCHFGMRLAKKKFPNNMGADHRRIMPQDKRFYPSVTAAQQFNRACINENGHAKQLWPAPWKDFPTASRPRGLILHWACTTKNARAGGHGAPWRV
jgi:hypothetical protein